MLERILSKENMYNAYKQVFNNKGCAGIDGMGLDKLHPYLNKHWTLIKSAILSGDYRPQPALGIEIDKPKGGKRLLGIPTVLDRLIQQAIQQELSKQFDPKFSPFSYGFRKGKNCHQVIHQALEYVNAGHMELLGYGIYRMRSQKFGLKVIESNWQKFVRKCKAITKKTLPYSLDERFQKLRELGYGWIGYFRYAGLKTRLAKLDSLLMSRLRYCIWKSWKRLRTRIRNLKRLGVSLRQAISWGFTRKGGWHIVNSPILQTTITNERLKTRGFLPMSAIFAKYCHV